MTRRVEDQKGKIRTDQQKIDSTDHKNGKGQKHKGLGSPANTSTVPGKSDPKNSEGPETN